MTRRFDLWLPTYAWGALARLRARLYRRRQTTHIMFLVCDHFEPRHGIKADHQAFERVQLWQRKYAEFQERCRESFGLSPLHTWFYPPHHGVEHLPRLAEMAFDGLGEVELHYHHHGDSPDTLRRDLLSTLEEYRHWGLLLESGETPRTSFGFIHGDWALGNSGGGQFCGVNDEVSILQELGCWGDFTMPSGNQCQTRKINSIYYGVGNPDRPKAHDWGPDAQVGRESPPGLFMLQGPLAINWGAPNHPRPENGSLTSRNWGRADRIQVWLNCNVHVRGRPDWLFVKLHTHGAIERDFDALFGEKAFAMHRVLNTEFNDGVRFRLHYVTARQAYNIAKAAEDGRGGDPSEWLDYRIQPPPTHFYALNARHHVRRCTNVRLTLENIEGVRPVQLRTRVGSVKAVGGQLRSIDVDDLAGTISLETRAEPSEVALTLDHSAQMRDIVGGSIIERTPLAAGNMLRIRVEGSCVVRYRTQQPGTLALPARSCVGSGGRHEHVP